jgi:hypothetical protein
VVTVKAPQRLLVEVYSHGGWWKDANGRSGQVPEALASRSPLATVAALANTFGLEGWQLADVVSARHNTYVLTFERVAREAPPSDLATTGSNGGASITLG